ncbi:MAG: hypothetical protein WD354_02820 [Acidimicrobiia bacterium]
MTKYGEFFELDFSVQNEQMKGYSPEKQVEIYLVGQNCIHPPRSAMAGVIASQGGEVIKALLDKLNGVDNDWDRILILDILGYMSCWHKDLSESTEVIRAAEAATRSLKPVMKHYGEEELKQIRRVTCPITSPGGQADKTSPE